MVDDGNQIAFATTVAVEQLSEVRISNLKWADLLPPSNQVNPIASDRDDLPDPRSVSAV